MFRKKYTFLFAVLLTALSAAGCSGQGRSGGALQETQPTQSQQEAGSSQSVQATGSSQSVRDMGSSPGVRGAGEADGESGVLIPGELPDIELRFGESETFVLKLDQNNTAAELARSISGSGMNLPIYHFDDFENFQVMQYYDIPDRFEIPSEGEQITSEKAGEVYYSAPNRIILFYQDAEIPGEFTRVGYMEDTEGLKDAVEDNPVVEGWGNKIITVSLRE